MKKSKNYALPNASWGPDMLSLYHEFLEKTKTSGWVRVPSFRSNRDHIQGFKLPLDLSANSGKAWPKSSPWQAHAPAHWNQFSQPLFPRPETFGEEIHKLSASSQPEVLSDKSTSHDAAPGTWMRKASSQPLPPPPLLLGDESTLVTTCALSPECTHRRTAASALHPSPFSPGMLALLSSLIPSPPPHPTKV